MYKKILSFSFVGLIFAGVFLLHNKAEATATGYPVKVTVLGPDSGSSAPTGVVIKLSSTHSSPTTTYPVETSSNNPAYFIADSSEDYHHNLWYSKIPNYKTYIGYCFYPVGSAECNFPSISLSTYTFQPSFCEESSQNYLGTDNGIPAGSGFCYVSSPLIDVNSGYNTNVWIQYIPTGSIQISRYGSDGVWSPNIVPAGTQGKVDSLVASSTDPSVYKDLNTRASHIAYASNVSGYTAMFGTCNYAIGDSECSIPLASFNITPTCSGLYCSIPTTVTAGQVTKVGVIYTSTPATIQINRVNNLTGTPISATQATILRSSGSLSTTSNPAVFLINPGNNVPSYYQAVTDLPGYDEFFRTCQYQLPATDCTYSNSFFPYGNSSVQMASNCDGTTCPTLNGVNLSNTTVINPGSGSKTDILYRQDVPATATTGSTCGGKIDLSWSPMQTGTYNMSTSDFQNYVVFRSTSLNGTYYNISGNDPLSLSASPSKISGTTYTDSVVNTSVPTIPGNTYYYKILAVTTGGFTKLDGLHADLGPGNNGSSGTIPNVAASSAVASPSCYGNVQISRYGSDGVWSPNIVPAGTQGKVDSLVASSTNPSVYKDLLVGQHAIYTTDLSSSGYIQRMGTCTYPIGGTECEIPLNTFSIKPTCSGGFCSTSVNVTAGQVVKVATRYVNQMKVSRFEAGPVGLGGAFTSSGKLFSTTTTVTFGNSSGLTNTTTLNPAMSSLNYLTDLTSPSPFYTLRIGSCFYHNNTDNNCTVQDNSYSSTFSCLGSCKQNINGGSNWGPSELNFNPGPGYENDDESFRINAVYQYSPLLTTASTSATCGGKITPWFNPGATVHAVNPSFKIYRSTNPTSGFQDITASLATSAIDMQRFYSGSVSDDSGLTPGSTYYYKTKVIYNTTSGTQEFWSDNVASAIASPECSSQTSTIRVSHYGSDLSVWPSPNLPVGTFAKLDLISASAKSTNPQDYASTTVGSHTVYVTDLGASYTETYGTCTYAEGGTECNIPGSGFTGTPACDGTYCSIPTTTTAGQVTKVGVMYTANTITCINGATNPPACTEITQTCPENGSFPYCTDSSGKPGSCPTGYTLSGNTTCTLIITSCPSPQVGTIPNCSCNNGLDPVQYPSCSCSSSQYQSGNICKTCPSYMINNGNSCTCPAGTEDNGTDACIASPLSIITFVAKPNIVNSGTSCNLAVEVDGASDCTITGNGNISLPLDTNGYASNTISSTVTASTKFTVTCNPLDPKTKKPVTKNTTCYLNPSTIER